MKKYMMILASALVLVGSFTGCTVIDGNDGAGDDASICNMCGSADAGSNADTSAADVNCADPKGGGAYECGGVGECGSCSGPKVCDMIARKCVMKQEPDAGTTTDTGNSCGCTAGWLPYCTADGASYQVQFTGTCDTKGNCEYVGTAKPYDCAGTCSGQYTSYKCTPTQLKGCLVTGCNAGYTCNATTGICDQNAAPKTCVQLGCASGYMCNATTGICEVASQSSSNVTLADTEWNYISNDAPTFVQVRFFSTNTFGVGEYGSFLTTGSTALNANVLTHYAFTVPKGAGLVCLDTYHQKVGGKPYYMPGQDGGITVNKGTDQVVAQPSGKAVTFDALTPPCNQADLGTAKGCWIGKVYTTTDTDNWNCFVPAAALK